MRNMEPYIPVLELIIGKIAFILERWNEILSRFLWIYQGNEIRVGIVIVIPVFFNFSISTVMRNIRAFEMLCFGGKRWGVFRLTLAGDRETVVELFDQQR